MPRRAGDISRRTATTRVLRLVALLAACAAAAGLILESSGVAAPARPSCAAGTASAASLAIEDRAVGSAETTFERSLANVSERGRAAAGARFATDLQAYLYGFPVVMVRRTILGFPHNVMVSIGRLADPATRAVVAPNHDTLYSVGQLDLAARPVVIHTPPTGGRYSEIQLLDGFTDVTAYLGEGAAARTGETAAIVAPGWHGSLPTGMRVIRPQTQLVWLLGRTLAGGPADTVAATRLLAQYSVTPLAAYEAGIRIAPLILANFPDRPPVEPPTGVQFFDELGIDLAADPPPPRDRCAISAFARAGVGPGRTAATLRGLDARTLSAAAAAGPSVLSAVVAGVRREPAVLRNGWATTPPDTGRFGTDYIDRALVAKIGLGANTNAAALYLSQDRDSGGRPLSGANVYTVHFRRGQLPPARAFWSLTLYDSALQFYANPLDRYALGNRSGGLRDAADGDLTIVVSHQAPAAAERANWLPAPAGTFSLYLRLYEPTPAALDRSWLPPSVVRSANSG